MIADKGLIGSDYQQSLYQETGVNLQTACRANMQDRRHDDTVKWLTSTRRLVETVIGQLTEHFHIQKIRARDVWHLTNRIIRKVLAHTVSVLLNKQEGNAPLQLEKLLSNC